MSEVIKRYALPIESFNLCNNGLRSKECILLVDSLQRHFPKLGTLNISQNKIGIEGAKHLANNIKNLKILTTLNLSGNEIGDLGITEILKEL